MKRIFQIAAVLILSVVPALAQKPASASELAFQRYDSSYFEKNNSGLKGATSYLVITSQAQFDQIFGPAAVMGQNNFLPAGIFDSKMIVATIRRASFVRTYTPSKVTASKGTVYVWYDAKDGAPGSARYSSPLILAVDKGHYSKVIFMQNGKKAGAVLIPKTP